MRTAVFLGGNVGKNEQHQQSVMQCAKQLADSKIHAYYGGGHIGLMGVFADTYLKHQGQITGIMPQTLIDAEQAHTGLSELIVVQSMTERKQILLEQAQSFLVLPGGVGTIDEFFMVWTESKIGTHQKPIVILNTDGIYQTLLDTLQQLVTQGFIPESAMQLFFVTEHVDQAIQYLQNR